MTPSIRRARAEDAPGLAAVHIASWRAAYRDLIPDEVLENMRADELSRSWAAQIRQDADARVWVVEVEGRIVAYARVGEPRDQDSLLHGGTTEIYGFYVDPAAWGSGLGRALMGHVLDEVRERGFSSITLNVVAGNERARSFYERVGFSLDRAAAPWHGAPQVRYRIEL